MIAVRNKPQTLADYRARLVPVVRYIASHLDDELSLDTLAEIACFSPFHFHRVFQTVTGESVGDMIRRLRLERAAVALAVDSEAVMQIALSAGYRTAEAFTRAFSAAYHVTPSRFRKFPPIDLTLPAPCHTHWRRDGRVDFKPVFEGAPSMIIHVKRIDPIRVAYMRAVGPYPKIFPELWKTFCDEAMKRHLFKPDAMYISLCNDDPGRVPEDQLRGDACVSVSADFKPDETIKLQTIAGGEYAIGEYKGPYTGLQKAWGEFCAAVSAGGDLKYRAMPSFEVYLSDPKTCPPEELRTDMYVAVERLTA